MLNKAAALFFKSLKLETKNHQRDIMLIIRQYYRPKQKRKSSILHKHPSLLLTKVRPSVIVARRPP